MAAAHKIIWKYRVIEFQQDVWNELEHDDLEFAKMFARSKEMDLYELAADKSEFGGHPPLIWAIFVIVQAGTWNKDDLVNLNYGTGRPGIDPLVPKVQP